MVSSTVLYLFLGQILIALFLFYLLPITSAELPQKISKKSKPIITLSHGKSGTMTGVTAFENHSKSLISQIGERSELHLPKGYLNFRAKNEHRFASKNETFLLIFKHCVVLIYCVIPGQVRGTLEKSQNGRFFSQFVGIPYAQPPIGKLRFARPQPWTESWNETILDANKRPLVRCVQFDDVTGDVKGTEDCLKLNIYVPRK